MAGLTTITEPSRQPLEVQDVRNYLKLDSNHDEIYVRTLIGGATKFAENYTGRALINRRMKLSLDSISEIEQELWEGVAIGADIVVRSRSIELPSSPVSVVHSVKIYDDADVATTVSTSKYYSDTVSTPARVTLRNGESWTDVGSAMRHANAIEVEYTAGYGESPLNVPEPIRLAMYQYIAFLYEHRGEFERYPAPTMPVTIADLLHPYKIVGIGKSPFQNAL